MSMVKFQKADIVRKAVIFQRVAAFFILNIKYDTTDVNGNIFFTGLANGTYTIEIVPKSGWTSNNPTGGSQTVTLSNNNVSIINFYNCKK